MRPPVKQSYFTIKLFCAESKAFERCYCAVFIGFFEIICNRKASVLDEFLVQEAVFLVEFLHTAFCDSLYHDKKIMMIQVVPSTPFSPVSDWM